MSKIAVIPASETRRESPLENDSGQAGMTSSNFVIRNSSIVIRQSLFYALFLVLILTISACVKSPQVRLQIDESVAALIDREISCAEAPEGTCAIDSEFQKLADQATADSTPETPIHYATILNDGQDALLTRLHMIRSARKSISPAV